MLGSTVQNEACSPAVYRPRRPARTILHKVVRENLQTYLKASDTDSGFTGLVPFHVQKAFGAYIKCGILAHGFLRVFCSGCGHDFLTAFSCKGRDLCPSCTTRHRVETAAHILVTDGVFFSDPDDEALFHPAMELDTDDFLSVQTKMRSRGLRWMHRHEHLDSATVASSESMDHAGGWSVDASARIEEWNRQGLERLVRYGARPPISGEILTRLNDTTLVYSLCKPTLDGRMVLYLTPIELLERLSKLITPPRCSYCRKRKRRWD